MIKSLYDPAVEERGIEKGRDEGRDEGIEKGREEMRGTIHCLLSGSQDYVVYEEVLSEALREVKELSMLSGLILVSSRVKNVEEFIQHLNNM